MVDFVGKFLHFLDVHHLALQFLLEFIPNETLVDEGRTLSFDGRYLGGSFEAESSVQEEISLVLLVLDRSLRQHSLRLEGDSEGIIHLVLLHQIGLFFEFDFFLEFGDGLLRLNH